LTRYARQRDLVPDIVADTNIYVIGVGAIGRPIVLQLAAIGARRLHLFDPDTVEEVNIPTQGYLEADVGQHKVAVCSRDVSAIIGAASVVARPTRFNRDTATEITPVSVSTSGIFCAVDSIDTRREIWEAVGCNADFWADVRMFGEVIRVLTARRDVAQSIIDYPETLFAAEETHAGRCTAQSTIYAATIAAGLAVHQFTRWLRGFPTDNDTTLNLLASDLFVGNPEKIPAAAVRSGRRRVRGRKLVESADTICRS
jgi:sulfur carrier protein ThiS adenylyltransferase